MRNTTRGTTGYDGFTDAIGEDQEYYGFHDFKTWHRKKTLRTLSREHNYAILPLIQLTTDALNAHVADIKTTQIREQPRSSKPR